MHGERAMISWLRYSMIIVVSLSFGMTAPILAAEASHLLDGKAFVRVNGEKGKISTLMSGRKLFSRMAGSNHNRAAFLRPDRCLEIFFILTVIVALNVGGSWLANQVNFQPFPRHDSIPHAIVLLATMSYIFLLAIPFMPSIEVGLVLMLMLGSKGALLVYLCTLTALSISYSIGSK